MTKAKKKLKDTQAANPPVTAPQLPQNRADARDSNPAQGRAFIRFDERPEIDGPTLRYPGSASANDPTQERQHGVVTSRKAFVVIASEWDAPARSFATRYADLGVRLMTPRDLSRSGWSYRAGRASDSTAQIGENSLSARDIAAVLTRIPRVTTNDVPHIAAADRGYVAAEMTAFLLAWLTELVCPVMNLPTPRCLSGPGWSHEEWMQTASRIGIPTDSARRQIRLSNEPVDVPCPEHRGVTVTIVGQRSIGSVDQALRRAARMLADAARTELLVVRFSGHEPDARFLDADHWADLDDRETGETVFQGLRDAKH